MILIAYRYGPRNRHSDNLQHNKRKVASFDVASAIPLAVKRGPYALAFH
jgi:hypothetical protein